MKKYVLCGHTGSINRGADAIIKSTADLISGLKGTAVLATFKKEEDRKYGFDEYKEVIRYVDMRHRPILRLIAGGFMMIKNGAASASIRQIPIIRYMKKGSISVSVGGDTYCYKNIPYRYIQMNKYCKKNNIPSVLWGCSIEKDRLCIPEILNDLKQYDLIFPREDETYRALLNAGFEKNKVIKMCDPAFTLRPEKVKIPGEPTSSDYVGINISPIAYWKNENPDIVKEGYRNIIQHILETTDNTILLIPHVYQLQKKDYLDDLKLHREMFELYRNSKYEKRIICLDNFYNSKQLKYIISKCRFLVAARTHASIAGYSSFVPTLVVGYSIKAIGIARDLFGNDKNYVIMAKDIKQKDELLNAYKWIESNERKIQENLKLTIPCYQKQAYDAAKYLINTFEC